MGETYLTKDGLAKLHEELKRLQKERRELVHEVERARAHGDLRENAEYHAAKERLQHVTTRLADLESRLTSVSLIDDLEIKADEARVGAQVTLEDEVTKEHFTYLLVGPDEADPQQGKLSIASPLGKALLGKKAGEQFVLDLPKTRVAYRLLKAGRPTG